MCCEDGRMRAAVLEQHGLPVPGEWDEPVAVDGHAVVRVAAAGVNPVDVSRAAGLFYGGGTALPSIVGSEGVGTMPGGRRVYFGATRAPYGSIAEQTLVDPAAVFDVPEDLDDGLAVALGIAGITAWMSLERGALRRGDHVLVLGAGGSVGQLAVQAARLLGAGRVVAAARSRPALERSLGQGADATVSLSDAPQVWTERMRDASDGRIDIVIDPLWGAPAAAAFKALSPRGRLVQIGQSAGAEATLASADVRGAERSILGYSSLVAPLDQKRRAYAELGRHALAGDIAIEVERLPLERVAEAFERQERGPGHKLVIVP